MPPHILYQALLLLLQEKSLETSLFFWFLLDMVRGKGEDKIEVGQAPLSVDAGQLKLMSLVSRSKLKISEVDLLSY
jgi:hypothetical protein